MKKLAALMLGMSLLFGTVTVAFGQGKSNSAKKHKKKHGKKGAIHKTGPQA